MEKKKRFAGSIADFFAGKGFYIVLFLCVAVIGVSAWILVSGGSGTDVELEVSDVGSNVTEAVMAEEPDVDIAGLNDPAEDENLQVGAQTDTDDGQAVETANMDDDVGQEAEDAVAPAETVTYDTPVNNEVELDTLSLFVWPVHGEVEKQHSMEALLYDRTMADWRTHDGMDIAADLGTQVLAASAGIVESIYHDDMYGTTVVINHGSGIKSVYSNLAEVPTVNVGDSVMSGEIIGAVGNTAICETGEVFHLHFAMTCDGESIDPMEYLP